MLSLQNCEDEAVAQFRDTFYSLKAQYQSLCNSLVSSDFLGSVFPHIPCSANRCVATHHVYPSRRIPSTRSSSATSWRMPNPGQPSIPSPRLPPSLHRYCPPSLQPQPYRRRPPPATASSPRRPCCRPRVSPLWDLVTDPAPNGFVLWDQSMS